ncbi:MAG: acyl-CoA thioesterase [Opitutales bacterium]|nr:acyl-CoA thioesterase [Opitutales bacterium]
MEASIKIKVPFYDLDPMQVVWHGNYIKYFEDARCALLDKIGLGYKKMAEMQLIFPIVKMQVKYIKPSAFAQELKVSAAIVPDESYLHIKYEVCDFSSGEKICVAETKQMCVDMETHASHLALPEKILKLINA